MDKDRLDRKVDWSLGHLETTTESTDLVLRVLSCSDLVLWLRQEECKSSPGSWGSSHGCPGPGRLWFWGRPGEAPA